MIHWGKCSSASPTPPFPPAPHSSKPMAMWKAHSKYFLFYMLNKDIFWWILFDANSSCFLSIGTWVWTTSVKSSPEPSIGCTCYQNCEYILQLMLQQCTSIVTSHTWQETVSPREVDTHNPGDGDWWLWPASDLSYQGTACSNTPADPGMAAQRNLIFAERVNIWFLKCLESRFCAWDPSRCFLATAP